MKSKSIIISIIVCIFIATISIGGTFAYLTSSDSKQNSFTIGNVSVSIIEPKWVQTVNNNENKDIAPGVPIEKDPKVLNEGKNPCYVRVKALIPKGKVGNQFNVEIFQVNGENSTDWTFKDGYYYYKYVLDAGQTTKSPIFQSVTLKTGVKEGIYNSTTDNPNGNMVNIDIIAEAIQSQGFNSVEAAWNAFTSRG